MLTALTLKVPPWSVVWLWFWQFANVTSIDFLKSYISSETCNFTLGCALNLQFLIIYWNLQFLSNPSKTGTNETSGGKYFFLLESHGSHMGIIPTPHKGHRAMSGDIFSRHNFGEWEWGGLVLASTGWSPGPLQASYDAQIRFPQQRTIQLKMPIVPGWEPGPRRMLLETKFIDGRFTVLGVLPLLRQSPA